MRVLEKIRRLIERLSPQPICDDCIVDRLALPFRQDAGHKVRELAGTGGFVRGKGRCSLCGETRLTISKL
jgi:hypothetical protein